MLFKQAFTIQAQRYNEYELNVNNNDDDFTIFFDHKKGIINIKNKKQEHRKMKIYKVFDDEWKAIYGIEQLKDFATEQVLNCEDNFLQDNLEGRDNWEEILELANKILNEGYKIQTLEEVNLVFQVRLFDIEELEVY